MARLAEFVATLAGRLSRLSGRGGGTSLPGKILLRIRPHAPAELASRLSEGTILVSATNGKTTTARLIRSVLDAQGHVVVANSAGANLIGGVTSALLAADDGAQIGLFEVDEAALPAVCAQLHPRVVVLMNLFRDQLDRYGELETLVVRWRGTVAALDTSTILVLNADDPGVAPLGVGHARVLTFGVDDPAADRGAITHAADSTHCPRCDAALDYDFVTISHQGHWRCSACGLARQRPDISATQVTLDGPDGVIITVRSPDRGGDAASATQVNVALPGLHNVYNALAAMAVAAALDIDPAEAAIVLGTTQAAFGRSERLEIDGRTLVLMLAKNPAGANENIRTVLLDPNPLHLLVMLNDRAADGRDVSWIWDVDYEHLSGHLADLVVAGDRAEDLALRFRYGGFDRDSVRVHRDPATALDELIERTPVGATAYVLPTYTALLDVRAVLVERGVANEFWAQR